MTDANGGIALQEESEVNELDQENEAVDGDDEIGDDEVLDADDTVSNISPTHAL